MFSHDKVGYSIKSSITKHKKTGTIKTLFLQLIQAIFFKFKEAKLMKQNTLV